MKKTLALITGLALVVGFSSSAQATIRIMESKIPIPLPVPTATGIDPITFDNIVDRVQDIPKAAFEKTRAVLNANSVPPITIDIFAGPNTKLDFPGGQQQIRDDLRNTAKLWSGFTVVKYISVYAYNSQDEPKAEAAWLATAKKRKYSAGEAEGSRGALRGNCQDSSAPGKFSGPVGVCGGSSAGTIAGTRDALMFLGMTGESKDLYFTTGALVGHEFTHTVQDSNWYGATNCNTTSRNCYQNFTEFAPCWIHEGQANIMGRLVVSKTLEEYKAARAGLPYGWGPTTVTAYSQPSLKKYLYNQSAPTCYNSGEFYKLGYSVGALTTEALTAIAGPQATMALYALGAKGTSFPAAFKKVYGISWNKASTVLSKVLAAEYVTAGKPPF
jgi:hypothetical protein